MPKTTVIEGRTVNQKDFYQIQYFTSMKESSKQIYTEDGYLWVPFKGRKMVEHKDYVYNFEVESDNSYTVFNYIVHNCQGLSKAKFDRTNLEDPRSKLFYEYIRILNEVKPTYFLLENVEMDQESENEFTRLTGVEPIRINSNLVSAQNRKRMYWTNIPNIQQPEDKGIIVNDILIDGEYEIFNFSHFSPKETKNYYQFDVSGKGYKSQQDRAYKITGKFGCFPDARAITKRKICLSEYAYRDLSLNECESLQTLPHDYTLLDEGFSINKSLSAIGNGWTVNIIAHILKGIKDDITT